MNAKVGNREVRGVMGEYGVEGRNENGESLIELCLSSGLRIMNTYFRKRRDNKLTWRSEINGEGALMDYVCVAGRECTRIVDVTVRKRAGGGLSDHYLVVGKMKIKKGWRRVGRREGEEVIKVWKLEEEECKRRFEGMVGEAWEGVRRDEWGEVGEEWRKFKDVVLRGAKEVCGTKVRMIGNWNKRSDWWCDEIGELIKRKKVAFEEYLMNRNEERWENYKEKCREVKRGVKEGKRRARDRWGNRVEEYAR